MKCIGHRCYFYFNSDIYSTCNLCEKYVIPGKSDCIGINHTEEKKIKLESDLKILQKRIKYCKKELDILKHLENHIKKNQYLIR